MAFLHRSVHRVSRRQFVGAAEHRFVERRVDILPAAGLLLVAQREQHADATVEAGEIVAQRRRAGRHRGALGHAGEIGQTAHRMRDAGKPGAVLVRTSLAIAGDAQHDQSRVQLVQDFPTDAPFLHGAGTEVLDQDVGLEGQILEHPNAFGPMQVDRHRLLVASLADPDQRVAARRGRAEVAAGVAAQRVLDLEHFGTELAEDAGTVGAGDDGGDVDDTDAGQRQVLLGLSFHFGLR